MAADVTGGIPVEGTTIAYATTVGGSYTTIPNATGIAPSNPEYERVDTWGLSSTVKTSRPGRIPEPGELRFRVRWDPSGTVCVALKTARDARTELFYKITYTGDQFSTHAFETVPGYITVIEVSEAEEENQWEADVTIQTTALPTFTAGV